MFTPAHFAAKEGNHKCLNYLFEMGASMSSKDVMGKTPIEYAIESKNKPTEEMIGKFPFYHNLDNELALLNAAVTAKS